MSYFSDLSKKNGQQSKSAFTRMVESGATINKSPGYSDGKEVGVGKYADTGDPLVEQLMHNYKKQQEQKAVLNNPQITQSNAIAAATAKSVEEERRRRADAQAAEDALRKLLNTSIKSTPAAFPGNNTQTIGTATIPSFTAMQRKNEQQMVADIDKQHKIANGTPDVQYTAPNGWTQLGQAVKSAGLGAGFGAVDRIANAVKGAAQQTVKKATDNIYNNPYSVQLDTSMYSGVPGSIAAPIVPAVPASEQLKEVIQAERDPEGQYAGIDRRGYEGYNALLATEMQKLEDIEAFNWAGKNIAQTREKLIQEGANAFTLQAYDAAVSAGGSVANLAFGQIGGTLAIQASSMPGAYNEALADGATPEQAYLYAYSSGAVEALTEQMFGGIAGLGEGVLNKLGSKLPGIVKNAYEQLPSAAKRALDAGGEGVEEMTSTAVSGILKRLFYNKDASLATMEEIVTSGLMGTLSGLIIQGGEAVVSAGVNAVTSTADKAKSRTAANEQPASPALPDAEASALPEAAAPPIAIDAPRTAPAPRIAPENAAGATKTAREYTDIPNAANATQPVGTTPQTNMNEQAAASTQTPVNSARQNQVNTVRQRIDNVTEQQNASTSTKALGITNGTDTISVTIIDKAMYDPELRTVADNAAQDGRNVTFVIGDFTVTDAEGNEVRAMGAKNGVGDIIIKADSLKKTATEIYNDSKGVGTNATGQEATGAAISDRGQGRVSSEFIGDAEEILRTEQGQDGFTTPRQIANNRQGYINAGEVHAAKISAAELGIPDGTNVKTLSVFAPDTWDAGMKAAADEVYRRTGRSVTYVSGEIRTKGNSPNQNVRGYVSGAGNIIVQADNANATAEQIVAHELFHATMSEQDEVRRDILPRIQRAIEKAAPDGNYKKLFTAYYEKYHKSFVALGMNADEITTAVFEEILADAYAGLNTFGDTSAYAEDAKVFFESISDVNAKMRNEGGNETRGPPEGIKNENTATWAARNGINLPNQLAVARNGDLKKNLSTPPSGTSPLSHTPEALSGTALSGNSVPNSGENVNGENSGRYSLEKDTSAFEERDGKLYVNDTSILTTKELNKIGAEMRKNGYDWRDADDVRMLLDRMASYDMYLQGNQESAIRQAMGLNKTQDTPQNAETYKKATRIFGTTQNFAEAGYLTPTGRLLDFSGKKEGGPAGSRSQDHREIEQAYERNFDSQTDALIEFMNEGNVRLMPENNGINVSVQPTKAQERILSEYINRANGEIILDLDGKVGNTIYSVEYPEGTKAVKILNDIRNFFADGTEPRISEIAKYRYSLADDAKGVRDYLRTTKISISKDNQLDLTGYENFGDFRRRNMGRLNVGNEGLPVDIAYQEAQEMFGEYYFPENIINPADQLLRMAEVAEMVSRRGIDEQERREREAEEKYYRNKDSLRATFEQGFDSDGDSEFYHIDVPEWKRADKTSRHDVKLDDYPLINNLTVETYSETWQQEQEERFDALMAEYSIDEHESPSANEIGAFLEKIDEMAREHTEFENLVDYERDIATRTAEREAEEIRTITREDFKGTEAMDKLGIKIDGSLASIKYHMSDQIRARHEAASKLARDISKTEKKLGATELETADAAQIVNGIRRADDLSSKSREHVVWELAELYMAQQALGYDLIQAQRADISQKNATWAAGIFKDVNEFKPSAPLTLSHRTPQRNMIRMFGDELGGQINREVFEPADRNQAEMTRFKNRQLDRVRTFEDSTGKKRKLDKRERTIAQGIIEQIAIEQTVKDLREENSVIAIRDELAKGQTAKQIRKNNVHVDEGTLKKGQQLYRMEQVLDELNNAEYDKTIVNNAIEEFQKVYNEIYEAINGFLVAHGYEPIGFIKNYAPHMQPTETTSKMQRYIDELGVRLPQVSQLPTSIAGLTATYKPNKRWTPYFLERLTNDTAYDITAGFEDYITYVADVFFHTDDIMRLRAMSDNLRKQFSGDNIRAEADRLDFIIREGMPEDRRKLLIEKGIMKASDAKSKTEIAAALQDYRTKFYKDLSDSQAKTRYGDFALYLENMANIWAGKQSFDDRGLETSVGRRSLNWGNKITGAFARAQVSGNLSSAINNLAQLPMIMAENGTINTARAAIDLMHGDVRRNILNESDFLTGKKGVKFIATTKADMIIDAAFTPMQVIDGTLSALAYQGAYRKAILNGKTTSEAVRAGDKYAQNVMASREKTALPTAFQSKTWTSKMLHMFQTEALNTWDHIISDLPADFRQIANEHGKPAAARALAGVIIKMLIAAFVLNRPVEEVTGGTPAPFDIIGLTCNFIASGNGLATNEWLRTMIDNAFESMTGKRLFDTKTPDDDGFDWSSAFSDLSYQISNEVPFLRTGAAMLGLGDETLPLPDVWGAGKKIIAAGKAGDAGETITEIFNLVAQVVPFGRQATKTTQGTKTMVQGGKMSGYGEKKRLQYPVKGTIGNWVQAVLFGNAGLGETQAFYASGASGLSALQTAKFQQLVKDGADAEELNYTIQLVKKVKDDPDSEDDSILRRAIITASELSDTEKLGAYRIAISDSTTADKFDTLMTAGMSWAQVMEAYNKHMEIKSMDATSSVQATEFAYWVNGQDYKADQKELIKDSFKYFSNVPAEATRYESFVDAGITSDSAKLLQNTFGSLEPEAGKENVSDKQRQNAVLASNISTKERNIAMKQMLSESGYEKYKKAMDSGLSIQNYKLYRDDETALNDFIKFIDAGVKSNDADNLTKKIMQLKPARGKEYVSDTQKYRAAVQTTNNTKEQLKMLSALAPEATYIKVEAAVSFGVLPAQWVTLQELLPEYNEDGKGTPKQEEARQALFRIAVTDSERAVLWQLTNETWSASNNKFSQRKGAEVKKAMGWD